VTGQQLLADDFLSVQYGRPLKEGVPCINMSHTHEKGINVPSAKHSMHDIANKLCQTELVMSFSWSTAIWLAPTEFTGGPICLLQHENKHTSLEMWCNADQ
jgi:hypothetical protein